MNLKLCIVACCLLSSTSVYAHNRHKHQKLPISVAAYETASYLIADDKGNILKEHDIDLQRPIASISKLMVALLSSEQDLDESLIIPTKRDVQSIIPYNQSTLTRRELLTMALVKSDNFAAQILCNNIENCIDKMNAKAFSLEMLHTHYVEPTGLSKENVSTARDLLKLMIVSVTNEIITQLSRLPDSMIVSGKHIIKFRNTNPLTSKLDIILSKTGFTNPAGGCLIMVVNSLVGQRFLILLGSHNAHTRIPAMEKLYKESNSIN